MVTLRNSITSKISPRTKNQILTLQRRLHFKNVLFIITFGAVANEKAKIEITQLHDPNAKSQENFSNICKAVDEANSKLFWPVRPRLRFINGMSGQSFRLVLNRVARSGKNYLEIGTWRGSTACSAIDGNDLDAWLVDNWSEFGGPAGSALKNLSKVLRVNNKLSILSEDFTKVDFSAALDSMIDVYLFDGPHSESDHIAGAKVIGSLKFNSLVFIVDDWNWVDVRNGTMAGLNQMNLKLIYKIEIFSKGKKRFQYSRWHNGYCFFLIEPVNP